MALGALKRHWDRFGAQDPYWAVLTDPDKRGGRWDRASFFASGVREVEALLDRAAAESFPVARRRALDFGCGAGRLTHGLARHFERVDGVDVSSAMLKVAQEHAPHPTRCQWHLNTRPDLSLFADDTFDFVYSTLVLQHLPPDLALVYVRELVRVLDRDGLLVFQLPSARSTDTSRANAQTHVTGRLPRAACRAQLSLDMPSLTLAPGHTVTLDVSVHNASSTAWPALPDVWGRRQINVANRWLDQHGHVVRRDDGRCPLGRDLEGGHSTRVLLIVEAPSREGYYDLELDLVQEDVCWFHEQGSSTLRVPAVVGGGQRTTDTPEALVPPPRFSVRYPRAFHVLQSTGLRDLYWRYRRGLDHVRRRRDRVIIAIRDGLYLPRLRNWWTRGPTSPVMEMHWIPRQQVEAVLKDCRADAVTVDEERVPGYVSCRYWVRRSR